MGNLTTSIGIRTNSIRRKVSGSTPTVTYYLIDGPSANIIVDGGGNSMVWRI